MCELRVCVCVRARMVYVCVCVWCVLEEDTGRCLRIERRSHV